MLLLLGELEPEVERWLNLHETMSLEVRRCHDRRYPCVALMEPSMSPFWFIFGSGLDQALITLTGFDHTTFQWMEDLFTPNFNTHTP
jgi:hypothetical protein